MSYNKIRNSFYVSKEWVKIRTAYKQEHPLCEVCDKKNLVVASTEIDHIIAIRIDWDKRLDWDNLMSLCHRCHMKKTKAVDERILNGLKPKPWSGADVNGIPLDSEHW